VVDWFGLGFIVFPFCFVALCFVALCLVSFSPFMVFKSINLFMYIQVAIGEISCADTGLEKETFLFVVKLSLLPIHVLCI
jgi:hypothetical protein